MKTCKPTQIISLLLFLLAGALSMKAASGIWTADSDGNWSDSTKWSGGTVADGDTFTADFSTINLTADRTVTLDAGHMLSNLKFGDASVPDHNWTLSGANTLTLGTTPGINVVNQTATISSLITGTAFKKTGAGMLVLNGSAVNGFTGTLAVSSGTLTEDFSNLGTPTDLINNTVVLSMGGGKLNLVGNASGTTSQTFASTTATAGANVISLNNNGGAAANLTLGSLSRSNGSELIFTPPATGTISTTTGTANTLLGAATGASQAIFVTDSSGNILDWAAKDAGNTAIVAGSSVITYINGPAGAGQIDVSGLSGTLDVNHGTGITILTGTVGGINAIRFNTPGTYTFSNAGSRNFTGVASILVTTNVGVNNIVASGAGSFDENNGNDMTVVQDNAAGEFVWSGMSRFRGAGAIVKLGRGTVVGTANNNFTGQTFVNGGVLAVGGSNFLGAVASGSAVNLNGGTLMSTINSVGLYNGTPGVNNRNVNLGSNGGGLAAANGTTLRVAGVVGGAAGTGPLTVGIPASSANGNVLGLLPGTGSIANGQNVDTANTTAVFATGTVFLSGANTYTGNTVITSGTLQLGAGGSINNSPNIIVNSGATFDVSPITFTMGSQTLSGVGTVNGSVATAIGSAIYPATDGTAGTLTFNNNLDLNGGGISYFDLSTTHTGGNDAITVGGVLTAAGTVHIKALSGAASLDTTADYVLFTVAGSISGTFSSTPAFDGTAPANAASFHVITDPINKQVYLRFSSGVPPSVTSASVSPASAVRGQNVTINAAVSAGSPGTINPSTGVTVNLLGIGGSNSQVMTDSGDHVNYSYTATVLTSAAPGVKNLSVIVTDSSALSGSSNLTFTVNPATETWNGGDFGASHNWSDNGNWASGLAPGLVGDTLVFDGSTGLAPNLENNYSVTSVTFPGTAGAFTIGTGNGSTLTLSAGGVTNNSANPQTLNVPVVLSAAQTLNAASGALTLGSAVNNGGNLLTVNDGGFNTTVNGAISGSGGLAMAGTGVAALSGVNAFTGPTTISSGTLTVNGSGQLNNGAYAASIINNGTLNYNSSAAQTLSGVISGSGQLVKNNAGTLTLSAASTFTGNVTVNNGTLAAAIAVNGQTGTAGPLGNGGINTRTITVNGPGVLDLQINNVFGQLSAVGQGKNPTPPPIVVNGGTLQGEKSANLLGTLTLNDGTLIANCASGTINYRNAGYLNSYLSYQLGGDVTVTGSLPSAITNSQTSFATPQDGISLNNVPTTFNVADVTGNAGVDLTVQAAIADVNADYALSSNKLPGVLVKAGTGTMLLSGLNFYSGGTIVSAGTLVTGTTDDQNLPAGGSAAYTGATDVAGALGKPGTTIFLGDANTAANNSSPSLMIGGAFTVNHPIVVTNLATSGAYTLGGSTDNNATFLGAITVNEPLTISQAANTGANALTLSGGITSGGGTQTLKFSGPGNVAVTTAIANGSGQLAVNVTGGTLTLSAGNTYTGDTAINAGTLALTGSGSISSPNIVVGSGATFDVSGTGGFTLSSQTLSNRASTATLAGNINTASGTVSLTYVSGTPALAVSNGILTLASTTTFNVDNTGPALSSGAYRLVSTNATGTVAVSDTLPAVTLGGNTAGVASASLQINGGELDLVVVASSVNPHPPKVQFSISGNTLSLGWPTNLGWTLQTNSVGLANTNAWFPYPGSTSMTNVNITIDPTKANVFYRMVNP
jgi:autotransporter-associated beta strand protein